MECCVEYYSELYSKENTVNEDILDTIECLPVMEELKRKTSLATGKTPGKTMVFA